VEQPRDFPSQRAPVVQQQQQQPGYYYHQQPYSPQQQQQPLAEGTTTSYSVLKPVPESDIYRSVFFNFSVFSFRFFMYVPIKSANYKNL
jgi:hypothetical protein